MRQLAEKMIVIASNNEGKVSELKAMLAPFGIEVKSARDFDLEDPEETGETFVENAKLKAEYFATKTGLPALADDSGLCLNSLGGRPGVYTARYAPSPEEGMKKLDAELGNNPDRSAYFACCLVIAWPDGDFESFEAQVHGAFTYPPRGNRGFAYDPAFIPLGHDRTFAEMTQDEKAGLSHRGRALRMFVDGVLCGSQKVQDVEYLKGNSCGYST